MGPDGTIFDTGLNSLNHYSYGLVMEFVYAYEDGRPQRREPSRLEALAGRWQHDDF